VAKKEGSVNRRGFLKGAAAGAAALVASAPAASHSKTRLRRGLPQCAQRVLSWRRT